MEQTTAKQAFTPVVQPVPFVQPKRWARWAAVVLAAAGWYVSRGAFLVSQPAGQVPLIAAVCGGPDETGQDGCGAVLTSPQAYVALGPEAGALRIPMATFGMAYFAGLLFWYLFVGPPTYDRRLWHLVPVLVLVAGAWYSASAIYTMAHVLNRWCAICLAAHALNGGLVLLTVIAWPWRAPRAAVHPHPSARLALAAIVAGFLALFLQVIWANLRVTVLAFEDRAAEYMRVIGDPQFVRWDFARQAPADIPLYPDETFGGSPDAPHTVVVFGDFQCTNCKQAHEVLTDVAKKYPDQVRVAFRYYPQDPACNPNPRFRNGGHLSACRAVKAAEAARALGGSEAYLRMRALLWERQNQLPTLPPAQQSAAERQLLESWAPELGLSRTAFEKAMESPEFAERIRSDIALADKLGISAVPVVYMDGKRILGWSKPETWQALLGQAQTPASQPETMPSAP